ncbi:hypothetical protein [Nocardioides sp. W7]|nr:hypothetical protein [Nocardioides sp. W7]
MSNRQRKRHSLDPVVERRRRLAVQWVGLSILGLVTAVLVVRALQAG